MFPAADFWNWGRTLISDFQKVLIFFAKAGWSFGKSSPGIKTCAPALPLLSPDKFDSRATGAQKGRNPSKDSEKYWLAKHRNTGAQKGRNPPKDSEKYWLLAKHRNRNWTKYTGAQKQRKNPFPRSSNSWCNMWTAPKWQIF